MQLLLRTFVLAASLAQAATTTEDPARILVRRIQLDQYKAHIKGLTQFGDRMQGTQRNRDAIDWLEKELRSYGYTNVERHRFMSSSGPLENIYATKTGSTVPGEMYIVSAHMDGRGGGEAADDDGSGCSVVLELARVLGSPDVRTDRSVRFAFWNNEEFGMDGSGTYAVERAPLQGTAAEPKWLGIIQHDMMMYDHGMPPGPTQSPNADIDIEYQMNSRMAADSAKLAAALLDANRTYAENYRATVGTNMAGTDSIRFQDLVASVSVRENERVIEIVQRSNPNHHEPTDRYDTYKEEDFRFGFNSAQTTMGSVALLVGARVVAQQAGNFKALFNGASLQGWTAKNTTPTTFSVRDGFIHVEGNSGWLQSEREYSNFRLRVEVRFLTGNADSGVFVRAVGDSIFLRGWPGNSYQVQARDVTRNQSANPIVIGNIYRHGNPGGQTNFDSAAALRVAKPTEQWQMLDIEVRGDSLNVTLNGTVVTRATGLANPRGYIGLQGEAGIVEYRSIEIQETP